MSVLILYSSCCNATMWVLHNPMALWHAPHVPYHHPNHTKLRWRMGSPQTITSKCSSQYVALMNYAASLSHNST